jgi:DNA-directed RNA polymerase specialized sigma24 family protein
MSDWRDLNDIELIRLAKTAIAALASCMNAMSTRFFASLYAHLDNRLDAEDLAEDIFMKVWNSLSGYHESYPVYRPICFVSPATA